MECLHIVFSFRSQKISLIRHDIVSWNEEKLRRMFSVKSTQEKFTKRKERVAKEMKLIEEQMADFEKNAILFSKAKLV